MRISLCRARFKEDIGTFYSYWSSIINSWYPLLSEDGTATVEDVGELRRRSKSGEMRLPSSLVYSRSVQSLNSQIAVYSTCAKLLGSVLPIIPRTECLQTSIILIRYETSQLAFLKLYAPGKLLGYLHSTNKHGSHSWVEVTTATHVAQ